MSLTALVDGDIVCYRCSATVEDIPPEDVGEILSGRINTMMFGMLDEINADKWYSYISGPTNFRYEIYPEYKANRKDMKRPKYLDFAKEWIINEFFGQVTDGIEADDAMGLAQTDETIICSVDKDMLQIPGKHYNFVTKELSAIDGIGGLRNFYSQLLIGDRSDNVIGVKGIGKKIAAKLLDGCETEEEMREVVKARYPDEARFKMNADVLWIQRQGRIQYWPEFSDAV